MPFLPSLHSRYTLSTFLSLSLILSSLFGLRPAFAWLFCISLFPRASLSLLSFCGYPQEDGEKRGESDSSRTNQAFHF
ncbi:hypothetical protein EDD21DRAFT_366061 [Dissophora ornata]|nr:hypothetical protein EDD21DRAFT_366061 [Dissophora ornata]